MIFEPVGNLEWMVSQATIPCALPINNNEYRIYCSGRDIEGRAQIGFFEISLDNLGEIYHISEKAVVTLGPLGSFDDRGLINSWIVQHNEKYYLYYSSWSLGGSVPFYFYVGLAISSDGGFTFKKVSASPILERNEIDPYLTASPCILIENGPGKM